MKDPINIALTVAVVLLLGYTVYKNMDGNSSSDENISIPVGPVDANGYNVTEIEGTPIKKMEKYGENNVLIESGEVLNDLKTGTWTTYHPDGRVKSVSSYLSGKPDGLYLVLTDKGHVELQAFYKDGVFDGNWITYQNGSRKKEERVYKMGKLNGVNRHYDRTGKLQKEIEFKNDVQDGIFKYYDTEGNITLEYEYKNGEKVSGGIVKE